MYSMKHIVNRVTRLSYFDCFIRKKEKIMFYVNESVLLCFGFFFLQNALCLTFKRDVRYSSLIYRRVIGVFVVFCLLFVCPRAQLPVDTRGRRGEIRWDLTVRDNLPTDGLLFITAGTSNTWRGALVINIYGTKIKTEHWCRHPSSLNSCHYGEREESADRLRILGWLSTF